MAKDTILVPAEFLKRVQARYPGSFQTLLHQWDFGKDRATPSFADAVFLLGQGSGFPLHEAVSEGVLLYACAGWARCRKVFSFDDSLARSLAAQADELGDTDTLPAEILMRLPYPFFYIQAPNILADGYDGCFVWLERGGETAFLRFLIVSDDGESVLPCGVELRGGAALGDCFPEAEDIALDVISRAYHGDKQALKLIAGTLPSDAPAGAFLRKMTLRAVQLLLYILSADAEVAGAETAKTTPPESVPNGTDGDFLEAEIFDVGLKIGAALRRDASAGGERRAHVRRGHWHHYWTGPKKDPEKRRLVLRWVNPVNVSGSEHNDISVSPVK